MKRFRFFKRMATMLAIAAFAAVLVSCNKDDIPPVEVVSVTVTPSTLILKEGEQQTLTATVEPKDAVDKTVTWSSSAPKIAEIDASDGEITAKAEGTATITAITANGKTATCVVTVEKNVIEVTSVTVDPPTLSLKVGETQTLTATVKPQDATYKTITWSSDAPETVDVDTSTGEITAKAEGTATITATAVNGKTATCVVTVENVIEVTSVTVDPPTLSLKISEKQTLTATVEPQDATDKTITWSSDAPETVEVDPLSGEVTAKAEGTAIITATAVNGETATCYVTVPAVVNITGAVITYVGSLSAAQLRAIMPSQYSSLVQTGIDLHKVEYNTTFNNNTVRVSGLFIIPVGISKKTPIVVYNHGSMKIFEAPSFCNTSNYTADIGLCYAFSTVFKCAILLPDYIGHGVSNSMLHPYIHAESLGQTSLDMIRAYIDYANITPGATAANKNVVIIGYSEGAYASVALHKKIQETAPDIHIVKTYAGAGPYDIEQFAEEVMTRNYELPANTISSFLWVLSTYKTYSGYAKPYSEIFSASDNNTLSSLNYELGYLNKHPINLNPQDLFLQEYVSSILNGNDTELNAILKENSLVNFVPADSLILFHSEADTWVYVSNTINAYNKMRSKNAPVRCEILSIDAHKDHEDAVEVFMESAVMNMFTKGVFADRNN
ncbi:MAG: Ig-like domain-containing protein [Prevotellaceae bacterium]|jgi:uncharacterized protein YjdB|nr:Ig-like domain-containing protein [Prevotellaceae bacterium]